MAMSQNRVIGKDGKLPWHIPEDLHRFKKLTMDKPIIMGRKTHESIGRLLSGRANIILSRNNNYKPILSSTPVQNIDTSFHIFQNIDEAINKAHTIRPEADEIVIIGGGDIFKATLNKVDRIYLTRIEGKYEGDVFFPDIQDYGFREMSREELKVKDFLYKVSFIVFEC